MFYKFLWWLFFTPSFYTQGTGTISRNVQMTEAYSVGYDGQPYQYVSAVDTFSTAHWDTIVFYAPSPTVDATILNLSFWVGSTTRIDSFACLINEVSQGKVPTKSTEALGTYAYSFTSVAVNPLNKISIIFHVKTGGSDATIAYLRKRWILQ